MIIIIDTTMLFYIRFVSNSERFLKRLNVQFEEARGSAAAAANKTDRMEAGVDDGGLTNEMYSYFWKSTSIQREDLFEIQKARAPLSRAGAYVCSARR